MSTETKIDFIRYTLHELMLPHHFSNDELIWRCNRVINNSQRILNQYGLPQTPPEHIRLLQDEKYYAKVKDEEIARLNIIINRYEKFFKVLRFFGFSKFIK